MDLARGGGLVLFGEDPDPADPDQGYSAVDDAQYLDDRALADEPPYPVATGSCDIDVLADLGDIDTAFAAPIAPSGQQRCCYDDLDGAYFFQRARGRRHGRARCRRPSCGSTHGSSRARRTAVSRSPTAPRRCACWAMPSA